MKIQLPIEIRHAGRDFKPGFDCNRRIADLLRVPLEDEVPDYCARPDITLPLLTERAQGAVTELPMPMGQFGVVFTHKDVTYATVQRCQGHALASALLCNLEECRE